jgi:hypothetical protein
LARKRKDEDSEGILTTQIRFLKDEKKRVLAGFRSEKFNRRGTKTKFATFYQRI